MDFPILDVLDPTACYQSLVDTRHPDGLRCLTGRRDEALTVHDRHRPPVFDYRCRHCRSVFNAYTGTPLQKTHRSPAPLVLVLRGIWQGTPTARLARELTCDRKHLLALRHKLQGLAEAAAARTGAHAGADEMYQNAGETRGSAPDPGRPAPPPGEQAVRARHLRE